MTVIPEQRKASNKQDWTKSYLSPAFRINDNVPSISKHFGMKNSQDSKDVYGCVFFSATKNEIKSASGQARKFVTTIYPRFFSLVFYFSFLAGFKTPFSLFSSQF